MAAGSTLRSCAGVSPLMTVLISHAALSGRLHDLSFGKRTSSISWFHDSAECEELEIEPKTLA